MKVLIILLVLLMATPCFAVEINEKYSYKDFLNMEFTKVDPKEFNNSIIIGSCFAQGDNPDADIFPDGLEGVIFEKSNLTNVRIKTGMTVGEGSINDTIKIQNDLEDWVVEKILFQWKPIEPVHKDTFIELGISIDPKDISKTKKDKPIMQEKIDEINSLNP